MKVRNVSDFDARYPGNKRWKEAIDSFFDYGLHGGKYYEDENSELYEVLGVNSEKLLEDFGLTPITDMEYCIWKSQRSEMEKWDIKCGFEMQIIYYLYFNQEQILKCIAECKPIEKDGSFYDQAKALLETAKEKIRAISAEKLDLN